MQVANIDLVAVNAKKGPNCRTAGMLVMIIPETPLWKSHTLIYSANRVLGLFLRAEQSDEFQNVAKLLGVQNKQELQQRFLTRVEKERRFGRLFSSSSAGPVSLRALMNLDRLDTVR